jgi:hypothetical protein
MRAAGNNFNSLKENEWLEREINLIVQVGLERDAIPPTCR